MVNKWYYVTQKGNQTGWAKIDGNKYYFDKKGVMQTGLVKVGNKKYFFARSGEMKTGWRKINKKWYYFNKKTGSMKRGWQQLGKRWYYLNQETGIMETGWTKIDGKTYYFAADGSMYDGGYAYKIGKKYYYFEKSGCLAYKEGWKVSNTGARYYAYKDGTVAVNKKIKGKMVNAEGVRTIKTNNEMDKRAQGYSSNTDYLVVANGRDSRANGILRAVRLPPELLADSSHFATSSLRTTAGKTSSSPEQRMSSGRQPDS